MIQTADGRVLLGQILSHRRRVLRRVRHNDVIGRVVNRRPVGYDAHARLSGAKLLTESAVLRVGAAAVRVVWRHIQEERSVNNATAGRLMIHVAAAQVI